MDRTVLSRLRVQAREWVRRERSRSLVGEKGGRPRTIQAYLEWLLTEDYAARGKRHHRSTQDRKIEYVRLVAPWDGPRPWAAPRPLSSFLRSLRTRWPKEGELELRGRAVDAVALRVVLATHEQEVLEESTITRQEIPRLVYYRTGDPAMAEYWRRFGA